MKRRLDLCKKILLAISDDQPLEFEGFSEIEVGHHIYLLMRIGLVDAFETSAHGEGVPRAEASCLTWRGHDVVEKIARGAEIMGAIGTI